ncbi:MAG: endo alpha-1,4 polygalactosaminidase [Hyphomicrobiaceae bacterium]
MRIRLSHLLGAAVTILLAATPALADREAVKNAKSWSYQLTGDMASTKRSNADVAVVDPDHAGDANRFKSKANGGKRQVLAYISVGEAEEGRKYMKGSKQSWNTGRTQGWSGNYAAKYWDEEWKQIVKGRVREALAKGYDGVYLDRVDTYENVKAPGGSREQMVKLVKEVAAEARAKKGNAAVVVQNAEELLNDKGYVAAIDGIAKEDLYHGINHRGERNSQSNVSASKSYLKKAKSDGKAVFVVEYLNGGTADKVADEARRDGFVPNTHAPRNLSRTREDD